MTNLDLNLLDAIQMAMEAEQKAAAFYADAAQKTANPLGRGLFDQLAEFERYHYAKLADLEKSMRDEGAFIEYEGRELTLSVPSEVDNKEANKMSVMEIITLAINAERDAEKRYTTLAEQTTDPDGQAMFKKLAKEEHTHYRILSDEYYNLNNHGVWVWSE
jgi:rubrerythrin